MFKRPGVLIAQSNFEVLLNLKTKKLQHSWVVPQGYDSGIKVYCRKLKKKVPLVFPNQQYVKWYICGPTVYDVSHIGHASCYIRFDIINRILREFFNIKPIIGLGITDIDDKIIVAAHKKNVDFRELTKQHELEFLNNLKDLNILPPSFILRVTDHFPEIFEFISKIIEKGDAYVAVEDGSVYFSSPPEDLCPTSCKGTLQPGQKQHSDFALWKGARPGEPYWESPWGKGRPGWHIECSAMASKVFGSELDLHGGGIDLEFPHHANEEKQSCSYHGCNQWVNYWIYTGELEISKIKMSKSLYNYVSISDFLKSYTADELRMFCFISKYNKALHYGPDAMNLPKTLCELICKFIADSDSYVKGNWTLGNISESDLLQDLKEANQKVREHLMNDFDTSAAHIALMELVCKTVKALNETPNASYRSPAALHAVSQYVRETYQSFGFHLEGVEATCRSNDHQKLEFILDQVVKFRSRVRAEALQSQEKSLKGNLLKACDSLRNDIKSVGVVIKDQAKDKSSWSIMNVEEKTSESAV